MNPRKSPFSLIVTSIASPNAVLRSLAEGASRLGIRFLVIGDSKSPAAFELAGCEFHSLESQRRSGLKYASLCPERSYARKNIGYLMAIRDGATVLAETDDDNYPREAFWGTRQRSVRARHVLAKRWVNAYGYFSEANIWPRGLPLTEVQIALDPFDTLPEETVDCPIQQGLADENPDVDAIYRLLLPLPQNFRSDRRIALGPGAWCPFNSQNTTWWADAFPLLYLPAHCSFRMTDIWRSFVAQRIAWTNNWSILFHEPTVWQERNDHSLLGDFRDEIPGYLLNAKIGQTLEALDLQPGTENIPRNLLTCYRALIGLEAVGADEIPLLEAWLEDIREPWNSARTLTVG